MSTSTNPTSRTINVTSVLHRSSCDVKTFRTRKRSSTNLRCISGYAQRKKALLFCSIREPLSMASVTLGRKQSFRGHVFVNRRRRSFAVLSVPLPHSACPSVFVLLGRAFSSIPRNSPKKSFHEQNTYEGNRSGSRIESSGTVSATISLF